LVRVGTGVVVLVLLGDSSRPIEMSLAARS
jgi:hypothetical protein